MPELNLLTIAAAVLVLAGIIFGALWLANRPLQPADPAPRSSTLVLRLSTTAVLLAFLGVLVGAAAACGPRDDGPHIIEEPIVFTTTDPTPTR